jgi:Arm DNA-binding domain
MGLTDAKLRALKGQGSPYKLADGEGLYVLVPPKGSRLWRLAYRYMGKQITLACLFGVFRRSA